MIVLYLILSIIIICGLYLFFSNNNQDPFKYPIEIPGHRPALGDFLPVEGQVATGKGGYEYESDNNIQSQTVGQLTDKLYNQCIILCMLRRSELGGNRKKDLHRCTVKCNAGVKGI